MNGKPPTYESQVAEVRRKGWIRAGIATPFVAIGYFLALLTNDAIGTRLSRSLYEPACVTACEAVGGHAVGHRLAGRGHPGEVRCECRGVDPMWHKADLSRASTGDTILHYGGQELLFLTVFATFSIAGLVFASRIADRRSAEG